MGAPQKVYGYYRWLNTHITSLSISKIIMSASANNSVEDVCSSRNNRKQQYVTNHWKLSVVFYLLFCHKCYGASNYPDQQDFQFDTSVDEDLQIVLNDEDDKNQARVTIYENEMQNCSVIENKIILSLFLRSNTWNDVTNKNKKRAIQKLSEFFAIPKVYISLDNIFRQNLYDMTKTSIRQGIYQLSNNKKLGKIDFVIGCGKSYFSYGQLIANQIAQQMNDGSIDDISGLEFGWWLIWSKLTNVDHGESRFKRDTEPEESSGEYDEYNYDDDQWDDDQQESNKKTPNKHNEISDVAIEEHPHRHHHGDNSLLAAIDNKQSSIIHDNLASKQSSSSSSSSVEGDFVVVSDNSVYESVDKISIKPTNNNNQTQKSNNNNNNNNNNYTNVSSTLFQRNLDDLDSDIKNGVLKLEFDITKTIQNNNNKLKEVQQEIDQFLEQKRHKSVNPTIYDDVVGIISGDGDPIAITEVDNNGGNDGGNEEMYKNYDISSIVSETVPDDEFINIRKNIQNDPDNDYVIEDLSTLDKKLDSDKLRKYHDNLLKDGVVVISGDRSGGNGSADEVDSKNKSYPNEKFEFPTVKSLIETTTFSPLNTLLTILPSLLSNKMGIMHIDNNKNVSTTVLDQLIVSTMIPSIVVDITNPPVIQLSQSQSLAKAPSQPPTKQQTLAAVMTTAKTDTEESTSVNLDVGVTNISTSLSPHSTTTMPFTTVGFGTVASTHAATIKKGSSNSTSKVNSTNSSSTTAAALDQTSLSTTMTQNIVTSPAIILTTTSKQSITTPTESSDSWISTEENTETPSTIIVTESTKSSNPTETTDRPIYDDNENDGDSETTINQEPRVSPTSITPSSLVPHTLNVLPISNSSTTDKSTISLTTSLTMASSSSSKATTTPTTPTSSSTQLTTEYIDPEPANYPPTIRNRLPKLPVTAGKVFSLHVPLETFFDTEDGTNLKLTLLDKNDRTLKYNSWIQFNQEKREIYGLPLEDAVSKWQFKLLATDNSNETVVETLDISVQQHKAHRSANHEISIGIKLNEKFTNTIDWQILLIRAIGDITRDNSLSSIVVREVRYSIQDPMIATFIYTNDTLPKDKCPDAQLDALFQVLTASNLAEFVQPHMSVKFVNGKSIGSCAKSEVAKSKPKPTPHMTKNYPPVPRNQVDRVNATIGQLLVFKVPADTFYDPEDNTDLKLSLLSLERKPLDPKHWLQFDAKNHEFYGIPKYGDAGQNEYLLVAEDREGLTATDALVVVVGHPTHREYNSLFEMTLGMSHDDFNNSVIQRRFVEKIAQIFGDTTTSNVQIRAIRKIQYGKTMINYYNTTLHRPHHVCPNENIEQLRKVLVHQDGNIRHRVKDIMGAEFDVTRVNIAPMGACAEADAIIHHASIPIGKSNDNKASGFKDDYLLTFVLPAVIIIVMLLIATIIACVLHRRRITGKMELGDEEERKSFRSKGIPVIFQDELDEKPEIGNKSPIILKDEKPPLLPPSYNSTNPDDQEDMDEYVPPPAVVINGRESRGKSPVTPSYRKPPPYVSP